MNAVTPWCDDNKHERCRSEDDCPCTCHNDESAASNADLAGTPDDHLREWFTFTEGGVTYPFVEDDAANIHGYGHQDEGEFAKAVNDYDVAVGGVSTEDACWEAADVTHRWAVMDPDGERFWVNVPATDERVEHLLVPGPVTERTPGAFPITCLWGQR